MASYTGKHPKLALRRFSHDCHFAAEVFRAEKIFTAAAAAAARALSSSQHVL
jgi:hypothetical protein